MRGIFPIVKLLHRRRRRATSRDDEIERVYREHVAIARKPTARGPDVASRSTSRPSSHGQDKAEYARKGIARGRSIVTLEYDKGHPAVAENPSSLSKIGEIYDRIAFAGVGKFSEFDQLRKIGVRFCDVRGYPYSREDVRGKALANAYSQVIGDVFTREMKPLEVEMIVAEVGDPRLLGHEANTIYRVQYDGSICDHRRLLRDRRHRRAHRAPT